jgi:hypothetical protein
MHKLHGITDAPAERVAWILDDAWPETASMVAASFRAGDQLLAPGIFGFPLKRYDWPIPASHSASLETARRHWSMRRVAKARGDVRQSAYLRHDRLIARQLARAMDYRARHLVVAQAWLPWLHEAGALGGRTFDVVMNRYPLGEIHRLLDQAAAEMGPSATIADYRADAELVALEARLLDRARRVYTPHHGIAALFPDRAVKLAWHRPKRTAREEGNRVAFLGPTIASQRPDIARKLAMELDQPLVVFGPILEAAWDGVQIEQRKMGPNWLSDIGTIMHPTTMTHQPRALLNALAYGVTIYATPTCGLDPADYRPLDRFAAD